MWSRFKKGKKILAFSQKSPVFVVDANFASCTHAPECLLQLQRRSSWSFAKQHFWFGPNQDLQKYKYYLQGLKMEAWTNSDRISRFVVNCSCAFFPVEAILSLVQTFDKGLDAKSSEGESYLRTPVVHLDIKLPCVSMSMQMAPPSCKWEMSVLWGIGSALISSCSQQLWGPFSATIGGTCTCSHCRGGERLLLGGWGLGWMGKNHPCVL